MSGNTFTNLEQLADGFALFRIFTPLLSDCGLSTNEASKAKLRAVMGKMWWEQKRRPADARGLTRMKMNGRINAGEVCAFVHAKTGQ